MLILNDQIQTPFNQTNVRLCTYMFVINWATVNMDPDKKGLGVGFLFLHKLFVFPPLNSKSQKGPGYLYQVVTQKMVHTLCEMGNLIYFPTVVQSNSSRKIQLYSGKDLIFFPRAQNVLKTIVHEYHGPKRYLF